MASETVSGQLRENHAEARDRVEDISAFDSWIDGARYEADEVVETVDPVVGEPITAIPRCGSADVDTAVDAAWSAFDEEWSETTPAERSRRMFDWIDVLRDHVDELAFLECVDTGKPMSQARGEVEGAIGTLEYYASICQGQSQDGRQVSTSEDLHLYTRKEPYGVVGQITPWNFPIWAAAWKLGPALGTGNATVLKPSAEAPLTTIRIAELSEGILPDGVLNVVTGTGSEVGGALTEHDRVRKISFTGSVGVGQRVMQAAAENVAPVTLELGGKSPFIVFPDADLEKAVSAVADGIFYSTGEICDAFSRALVHESVHEEFVDRFVEKAESYTLGDPLDEETTMGPLTTESQYETVTGYIDAGESDGATLLTGGGSPDDSDLRDGWFVEPTVFDDVENDMRIAREEIFGPVQTINTFSSYDEAIELANDTEFGLAAGIATERTSVVHNAAADIEAGLVYVNEYGPILPQAPYGGFKESGIGKDLGTEVLDHYQQTKSVYVNLDEPEL
ncbi:aldehyde dehydrogenase [Haloterrigena sp. SYSU A121-1]|uniref:Aldehyde dehydrogenase n=1 Tax=Haloterrigena gelatinilytica TaxID=2741724 RepID=A0A8J8GNT6_9EURY|nr:aldehyde dehydrogenase family protein [Haloterrigena gelatinilytica]NUB93499.1 aldehyde dehydrogenase [Haloterrigena gelatinilytica]